MDEGSRIWEMWSERPGLILTASNSSCSFFIICFISLPTSFSFFISRSRLHLFLYWFAVVVCTSVSSSDGSRLQITPGHRTWWLWFQGSCQFMNAVLGIPRSVSRELILLLFICFNTFHQFTPLLNLRSVILGLMPFGSFLLR
jgi:hypothetical protein